jgi:DMSO/TMAO reductase YedYZ molybdopterin-dependent catalytic subunit
MRPPVSRLSRRGLIAGGAAFGGLLLSGCDRLSVSPTFKDLLARAEPLSMGSQRLLLSGGQLAREFSGKDISPTFRANGSTSVSDPAYLYMQETGFADYRLKVGGLVARPLSLTLDDLKAAPQRTQITRHDCVEGWSAIGQWTGTPLAGVLKAAGLHPGARYVVFYCADDLAGTGDPAGLYYESIDLVDAFHPQTLLAHSMNGAPLAVEHGAPIRLRVERQLGYKHAKYVMAIDVVDRLDKIGKGKGGFWEDRGYEWYAGI